MRVSFARKRREVGSSCLPLRGNCGFALPVAEKAKTQLPQRSEKWSKRTREHFSGYRKADGVARRLTQAG